MSETNEGANLMFALRTKTINEPMSETNPFVSENRFDSGFSSEGEHKVRPYIGFGHWMDFDFYDLSENLRSPTYQRL